MSAAAAVLAFAVVLDSVRDREHLARLDPDVLGWVVDHRTDLQGGSTAKDWQRLRPWSPR